MTNDAKIHNTSKKEKETATGTEREMEGGTENGNSRHKCTYIYAYLHISLWNRAM